MCSAFWSGGDLHGEKSQDFSFPIQIRVATLVSYIASRQPDTERILKVTNMTLKNTKGHQRTLRDQKTLFFTKDTIWHYSILFWHQRTQKDTEHKKIVIGKFCWPKITFVGNSFAQKNLIGNLLWPNKIWVGNLWSYMICLCCVDVLSILCSLLNWTTTTQSLWCGGCIPQKSRELPPHVIF